MTEEIMNSMRWQLQKWQQRYVHPMAASAGMTEERMNSLR
jgi:hypothetical protein